VLSLIKLYPAAGVEEFTHRTTFMVLQQMRGALARRSTTEKRGTGMTRIGIILGSARPGAVNKSPGGM
jgi:hypothetical protein